jgi:zinc transporter ZupT
MLSTTAGGFLYIATVGILPLVLHEKSSVLQIFLESIGFLLGVGFMVAVAVLEEINE